VARGRELLALIRSGAIDGLSIGFRTVKGRIDPRTRVRALLAVDLWEISIVTFPLLAGARVHAVKDASSRRPSFARTRAEKEWRGLVGWVRPAETVEVGRRQVPRRRTNERDCARSK
jgi:phage head maturation protease